MEYIALDLGIQDHNCIYSRHHENTGECSASLPRREAAFVLRTGSEIGNWTSQKSNRRIPYKQRYTSTVRSILRLLLSVPVDDTTYS
jgi:hypothetical protein